MAPNLQFLEVRERFLPIKRAALRERMLADPRLSAAEREKLAKLFEMIGARFHFEFHKKLERLKTLYDPFDPDCDAITLPVVPANEETQRHELAQAFQRLLLDANYVEMPRQQVVDCAQYPSQSKLVVKTDLSRYAQLRVFYRGIKHETRTSRPWLTPWKKQNKTVHVFSRVALLVRLADHSPSAPPTAAAEVKHAPVFLKLFKNVVVEDLEMLLPYVRIRMRWLDHLKIGSSVAGGMATASWKAFTASLSPWLFLLVATGFVGAAIRGFFGFLSSKTKYMQTLSSNLYFQNLANNAGALAQLTDSAEAEEYKELLLAYFILYIERRHDYTQEQLGRRVEQWLQTEFGLSATLDVSDAVQKLSEKNLLVRADCPNLRPGDCPDFRPSENGTAPLRATTSPDSPPLASPPTGVVKVYDLPSSLRRLDAVWDAYFAYNGVQSPEQDRIADAAWPAYPHNTNQSKESSRRPHTRTPHSVAQFR